MAIILSGIDKKINEGIMGDDMRIIGKIFGKEYSKWSIIGNVLQTSVTQQESVAGFHQSIAHSLVSLETNIHLRDIIRFSVKYINVWVFRDH